MRVMITGIVSPIARLVAETLAGEGNEVIGVDRRGWQGAPAGVEMHAADIRKRAAEELFRKRRPDAVIHMATVTHLVAATEERYRINLGGTRAVFQHANEYGVEHVIFVGRHTYYGAGADQALYHHEDDPPTSSPPTSTRASRCGAFRSSPPPCCASCTRSAPPGTARSRAS
jgi:UDP-glucose 4-epimerase